MTTHCEPNYMAIFWWLLVLTILEISVVYVGFSKLIVGFLLYVSVNGVIVYRMLYHLYGI